MIPVFGFDDWEYSRLGEVLIYPGGFDTEHYAGDGGADQNTIGMVGVKHLSGVMILSKPDLIAGFENSKDKRNVGIHEFAHLVDLADGEIDGIPAGVPSSVVVPWIEWVGGELNRPVGKGEHIDDYAFTNEAEYFAVLTEYFFEAPEKLAQRDPQTYEMMQSMYRQNTRKILGGGFKRRPTRIGRNAPCPCGSDQNTNAAAGANKCVAGTRAHPKLDLTKTFVAQFVSEEKERWSGAFTQINIFVGGCSGSSNKSNNRSNHMKSNLILTAILSVIFTNAASAQLKIYYIRHAQGGHNVKKAWQAKGIPESEWPAYVGDANVFTPEGLKQVAAATERLQSYDFDFIASSPAWRARNTIAPYLKVTHQKAEIWPELTEGKGMTSILSDDIPDVKEDILNLGKPVALTEEEAGHLVIRPGGERHYKRCPSTRSEEERVGYMKHVTLHAIKLIEERFGGTDKSILLAGHNSAGVSLLKLLLNEAPTGAARRGLINTGIWMVEQQPDGSYELKICNDEPYPQKP